MPAAGPALGGMVGRDEAFPRDENAHWLTSNQGKIEYQDRPGGSFDCHFCFYTEADFNLQTPQNTLLQMARNGAFALVPHFTRSMHGNCFGFPEYLEKGIYLCKRR